MARRQNGKPGPRPILASHGATLEELLASHTAVRERLAHAVYLASDGGERTLVAVNRERVLTLKRLEADLASQARLKGR